MLGLSSYLLIQKKQRKEAWILKEKFSLSLFISLFLLFFIIYKDILIVHPLISVALSIGWALASILGIYRIYLLIKDLPNSNKQ
jgi:hypothetical protein